MSWAEVKKINSNLDEPLNRFIQSRIVRNCRNVTTINYKHSAGYSTLTDVVSLSGKGVIHCIQFQLRKGTLDNIQLRLIVDNETLISIDSTQTSTYAVLYFYDLKDAAQVGGDSGLITNYLPIPYINNNFTVTNQNWYCFSPIAFQNSAVLQVKAGSMYDNYFTYELIE